MILLNPLIPVAVEGGNLTVGASLQSGNGRNAFHGSRFNKMVSIVLIVHKGWFVVSPVSDVFLSKGYTGSRPDVLSRHQSSTQHQSCASTYRESLHRRAKRRKIDDVMRSDYYLTVDGEAFCDALRCIYFLAKHEIPHTTNFVPLRSLCVQLGNTTLPHLLLEGKNRTYTSEQTMKEMWQLLGVPLKNLYLKGLCFSFLFDHT